MLYCDTFYVIAISDVPKNVNPTHGRPQWGGARVGARPPDISKIVFCYLGGLFATFFSMWGHFSYFFSMWGPFHYFFPCVGGPFLSLWGEHFGLAPTIRKFLRAPMSHLPTALSPLPPLPPLSCTPIF